MSIRSLMTGLVIFIALSILVLFDTSGTGASSYPASPGATQAPPLSQAGPGHHSRTYQYQGDSFGLELLVPEGWEASDSFMGMHLQRGGRVFLDVSLNPKGTRPVTRANLEAYLALEGNESVITDSFETKIGGTNGTAFILRGGVMGDFSYYYTSLYHDTLFVVSGTIAQAPSEKALSMDVAELQGVIESVHLAGDFPRIQAPSEPYP